MSREFQAEGDWRAELTALLKKHNRDHKTQIPAGNLCDFIDDTINGLAYIAECQAVNGKGGGDE